MSPVVEPETLYWGLKFSEWISFAGLVLGPIIAVAITLLIEGRRRRREQRVQVLRMLLASRHLPGDATYSVGINLVQIEFNKDKSVMDAWHSYIEATRYRPSEENRDEHNKVLGAKQTKLIYEALRATGLPVAETDIQTSAYTADGFIQRDRILIESQIAMPEIAKALNRQIELMTGPPPEQPVQTG